MADKFVGRGREMRTPYLLHMVEKVYRFSLSGRKNKDNSKKRDKIFDVSANETADMAGYSKMDVMGPI
jgi:hypothetical protein